MTPIIPIPGFSEPVSAWTHLIASGVGLVLGIWTIRRARGNGSRVAAVSLFVFGVIFSMAMSGVYHLLEPGGAPRAVFQRLDHAAIWTIIVGTFTAIHVLLFRGFWGWGVASILWTLAATAISLGTVFFEDMPEWLSLTLYISVGWFGAVSTVRVMRTTDWRTSRLIVLGGVAYTVGAVADFARWPELIPGVVGPHELFHLTVIAGLSFHWLFVVRALERTAATQQVLRKFRYTFPRDTDAPRPPRESRRARRARVVR
jgi:channel protein (hemolysin III family)